MWTVVGQERAVGQLEAALSQGRLSHAYMLVGPAQVGKGTLAMDLARAVNCQDAGGPSPCQECGQCRRITGGHHADVRVIGLHQDPERAAQRREVSIQEVRSVSSQAHLKPYEGASRVFIFEDAETMSEEAANALLKTLEEPPPQTLLLLLTAQEDRLLPTIRSRCSRVELRPMAQEHVARFLQEERGVDEDQARLLARLCRGSLGWALTALDDPIILERRAGEMDRMISLLDAGLERRFHTAADVASFYYRDRAEALETLDTWLSLWRDLLLLSSGAEEWVLNSDYSEQLDRWRNGYTPRQIAGFIAAIVRTVRALDANVNPRLSLEALMLAFPEPSPTDRGQAP